ncbi:hypothetical protein GE061_000117 [Apolygus lucorum]|uniref:Uncharacterized protein n=1 Tax=Apolygus lucorum TaxID=248454 RepID=A0A6A4KF39_APOLU|nr:hypothetical protein GE061_000117 [Apolygus lucorum]
MASRCLLFVSAIVVWCDVSVARRDVHLSAARYLQLNTDDNISYFQQLLDHDGPLSGTTFDQRYVMDDSCFNSSTGPVFLLIGGEGAMGPIEDSGVVYHYVKRFNALLFQLEHRFYGESWPQHKDMRFLNSQQAVADIANFIQGMRIKYKLKPSNKWVVFGGSYAGSLAAWARQKYPELIHAAVSVSAPLVAQVEFREYDDVVRKAFEAENELCAQNVHNAALQLTDYLRYPVNDRKLMNLFGIYDCPSNWLIPCFTDAVAASVLNVVQYNYHTSMTVADVCRIMNDHQDPDLVNRYALVYRQYHRENNSPVYPEDNTHDDDYSWHYQVCHEFGWLMPSDSQAHLFGESFGTNYLIYSTCSKFQGFTVQNLYQEVDYTNRLHHGLNLNATRVVSILGSLDPWTPLGNRPSSPESPVITIPGSSHCEFLVPRLNDSYIQEAIDYVERLLIDWIRP